MRIRTGGEPPSSAKVAAIGVLGAVLGIILTMIATGLQTGQLRAMNRQAQALEDLVLRVDRCAHP